MSKTGYLHKNVLFARTNTQKVFSIELQQGFHLCIHTVLLIHSYYANRWTIEVFFRSHKRYMGLKSFMVGTAKAFDRLLIILTLAHFFFSCALGHFLPIHSGIRLCRHAFVKS